MCILGAAPEGKLELVDKFALILLFRTLRMTMLLP